MMNKKNNICNKTAKSHKHFNGRKSFVFPNMPFSHATIFHHISPIAKRHMPFEGSSAMPVLC